MTAETCDLIEHEFRRFGFVAERKAIQALLPVGTVGTYLLLDRESPVYVGRSDTCLRRRLSGHKLLEQASHVVWEPFQSAMQAYIAECAWYHELIEVGQPINQIHPARPRMTFLECPFCVEGDAAAFDYSMTRRSQLRNSSNGASTVTACAHVVSVSLECVSRPMAADAKTNIGEVK